MKLVSTDSQRVLIYVPLGRKQGFPSSSVGKESAYNAGDLGLFPGSGRSPGEGNGNPLQYSWLENSMDRGLGVLQSMGSQRVRHYATNFPFLSFSWKETPEAMLWISLLSSGCFNVFVDNLSLDLKGMLVTFYRRHTTGRFHGSMREMSQNCLGRLVKAKVFIVQSCPTLCDSMDCSPLGSSVHGIL